MIRVLFFIYFIRSIKIASGQSAVNTVTTPSPTVISSIETTTMSTKEPIPLPISTTKTATTAFIDECAVMRCAYGYLCTVSEGRADCVKQIEQTQSAQAQITCDSCPEGTTCIESVNHNDNADAKTNIQCVMHHVSPEISDIRVNGNDLDLDMDDGDTNGGSESGPNAKSLVSMAVGVFILSAIFCILGGCAMGLCYLCQSVGRRGKGYRLAMRSNRDDEDIDITIHRQHRITKVMSEGLKEETRLD